MYEVIMNLLKNHWKNLAFFKRVISFLFLFTSFDFLFFIFLYILCKTLHLNTERIYPLMYEILKKLNSMDTKYGYLLFISFLVFWDIFLKILIQIFIYDKIKKSYLKNIENRKNENDVFSYFKYIRKIVIKRIKNKFKNVRKVYIPPENDYILYIFLGEKSSELVRRYNKEIENQSYLFMNFIFTPLVVTIVNIMFIIISERDFRFYVICYYVLLLIILLILEKFLYRYVIEYISKRYIYRNLRLYINFIKD